MNTKQNKFRWPLIIFIISVIGILLFFRIQHFKIDTDLIGNLPQNDPVLLDSREVIQHMPFQDRIVIDVSHQKQDKDALVEAATIIETMLKQSGLFKKVGIDELQRLFPPLVLHITKNLPVLFTAEELNEKINPLLSRKNIKKVLNENLTQLQNLEGIGQAEFFTRDPLGFRDNILSKLADITPSKNASIYRGKLLSSDGRHLLIIAELTASGTDIKAGEKIKLLMGRISEDINKQYASKGYSFAVNPVGAYRAVLDNADTTKKDTERAVTISTIVIALLLVLGFPRPLVGLLALVPSILGTALAFIVYSFIHPSISILAIGFGGAIISFTVDYGITYLLFLDRPYKTYGMQATKEVWSLGLLAMLTTAVSFAFLFISGFPALAQIGEFAALGVVFTYICVHAFFPVIFPVMPPARRKGILPLHNLVSKLISSKGIYRFYAAIIFCIIMIFFAKPVFQVDLNSMNSVSDETLAAETQIKKTWGDIFNRIYLMIEGRTIEELGEKGDKLTSRLEKDIKNRVISSAFTPSMIYPGKDRAKENFNAWKKFWNKKRTNELKRNINSVSRDIGFSRDAFQQFFNMIEQKDYAPVEMPKEYYDFFGISKKNQSEWLQFSMLSIGGSYNGEKFYSSYAEKGVRVFDPWLFGARLGNMLMSGFVKMALIVGFISLLVAFLYLLDLRLTLISMAPTVFALVCTFGTLNILNQPLGIPTIMVTVAVIGMGTDYALYLVRAYQRYMDEDNASLRLVHMSVFLSFATTFAGFGLLSLSSHTLLKSAGLCLALGIGYSFIGAVTIVPPMLKRVYKQPKLTEKQPTSAGSKEHLKRVLLRYRHMEAYPRFFARFKIMCDPMFPRLADFVAESPKNILDIGCGYGVPSCWLLELYPRVNIFAIEPDTARAFIASKAFGASGEVATGRAPDFPSVSRKFDTAFLLDIIHYLNDEDLLKTLKWIHGRLSKNGKLIIRVTIPSGKKVPWERLVENFRVKMLKITAFFRTSNKLKKLMQESGFTVKLVESTAKKREETWIIAER